MVKYILRKGYTTKSVKGIDELNALSLEGWTFVKAIERPDPGKSEPEGQKEEPDEEEQDALVCGICGKKYKHERSYLKHIESCKG